MSLKRIELETNVELRNYTTIRIGGKAKFFFLANSPEELCRILSDFGPAGYILGRGSNLLVSDSPFERQISSLIGEVCLSDRWGNIQELKRKDLVFGYRFSSIGERIVLWA